MLKLFEIWIEGYVVPECHAKAEMLGTQEAETFIQACDLFVENHPKYKGSYRKGKDGNPIYWGCRLFDNEIDARKAFG